MDDDNDSESEDRRGWNGNEASERSIWDQAITADLSGDYDCWEADYVNWSWQARPAYMGLCDYKLLAPLLSASATTNQPQ